MNAFYTHLFHVFLKPSTFRNEANKIRWKTSGSSEHKTQIVWCSNVMLNIKDVHKITVD